MKFEVEKFLTLTALLAGAAASAVACSSTDGNNGGGGEAGTAQTPGGRSNGSAGESAGGAGGEGGMFAGGAPSEGGAPEGGAAEGGAGGAFACIGDGPAAEAPCDVWTGAGPDCSGEGNFATRLCGNLSTYVRPAVLSEFNDCVSKVGDVCNATGVQGCADNLIGKGCTQTGTAAACTLVTSKCTDGTLSNCSGILDLVTPDALTAAESCMDPASETFDKAFTGTCEKRLLGCLTFSL
jgi:hypothetical protein